MHAHRLLLERKRLDEAGNLGIAAHHFGELVRKVPVDLLDKVEHQIAALCGSINLSLVVQIDQVYGTLTVIVVLFFVQDLQTDNQNTPQKWN